MSKISEINNSEFFADLCRKLLSAEFEDFQAIDDSGGDGGNDGYIPSLKRLFAIYTPEKPQKTTDSDYKTKITSDLKKAIKLRDEKGYDIKEWFFVTPAPLRNEVHNFILEEAKKVGLKGVSWSETHLLNLLTKYPHLKSQFSDLVIPDVVAKVDQVGAEILGKIDETEELTERIKNDYTKRIDATKAKMDKGLFASAKDEYEIIVQDLKRDQKIKDPHLSFRAYNNLAYCNLKLNKIPEAIQFFKEANSYEPKNVKSLANLALAHLLAEDFDSALRTVEEALKIDSEDEQAISMKANILMAQNKTDEAVSLLKEKGKEDSANYLSAQQAMKDQNFEEAEKFFDLLLEKDKADVMYYIFAGQNLLVAQQSFASEHAFLPSEAPADIRNKFEKAVRYLSKAIEILKGQEQPIVLAGAYTNLSGAFLALEELEKAIEMANEALKIDPQDAIASMNKGISELKLGRFKEAIKDLNNNVSLNGINPELARALAYCHLKTGEVLKAKEILEPFIPEQITPFDLSIVELAIDIYRLNLDYGKAESLIEKIEKDLPESAYVLRIKAAYLKSIGKDDSENLLKKALMKADSTESEMIKADLADYYIDKEKFPEAVELYRGIKNTQKHTPINRRYLLALYRTHQFKEALEFINSLKANTGDDEFVMQVEAAINMSLGNLKPSADLYLKLYQKTESIDYLVNYGISIFRLGDAEKAIKALDSVKDKVNGVRNLLSLAQGYLTLDKGDVALELAYRALQEEPEDPQAHLAFINVFLRREQDVGDQMEEKYIKPFQDAINGFNDKFPSEKGLQKVEVKEGDVSSILSAIDKQAAHISSIEDLYRKFNITLGSVTVLSGKSIFDVWAGFSQIKETGIRISFGTQEERDLELKNAKEADEIVLDLTAALILSHTDHLNLLKEVFKKVYIHQSTLDELNEIIDNQKMGSKKGHSMIGKKNGKYTMGEIRPEDLAKNIALLEKIKNFFVKETEIVGSSRENTEAEEKIVKVVGIPMGTAALLALEKNIPLLSDDGILRQALRQDKGLKSFSTQIFMAYSAILKKIKEDEYFEFLLVLLSMHYTYISLNSNLTKYILKNKKGDALINSLDLIFSELERKETEVRSLIVTLSGFIYDLWMEPLISPIQKSSILRKALQSAMKLHNPIEILDLLAPALGARFRLLPIQLKEVTDQITLILKTSY